MEKWHVQKNKYANIQRMKNIFRKKVSYFYVI